MKRINELNIILLRMEGFKKFKERFDVKMDEVTCISGANGEGKSSIADAIAFAFFGTNFWGERDYDRLKNPFCNEMKVAVQFVDGDGEIHLLTRTRVNDHTTITLDSQQINQNDVPTIFAERDIFLSIFNPLYFIEKIASDGRAFLQKLLPPIDDAQVLAKLNEITRTLLENEDIGAPELFVKRLRSDNKELEKTIDYISGQIDLLKKQRQESLDNLDSVIERGNVIVNQKDALEEKQFAGIDVEALKQKLEQISPDDNKRAQILARIAEAENRQYVSKCLDKMAELKSEIVALSNKSKQLAAKIKGIQIGDVCPTCGTLVTNENYDYIITGLRKEYNLVCSKGKNTMEAYRKLEELDKSSRETFEKFRNDDVEKAKADLVAFNAGDASEAEKLKNKIRLGNLTEEEYAQLCELKKQADAFAEEVNKICEADKIPGMIEEFEKKQSTCKQKMQKNSELIKAVLDFAAKRAEMILANLKMNRAAIKLTDVVKTTGEIKDVFKFTYDNKDYLCLSASERIRAGLEVSELLSRLTGLSYTTYIDNAECITNKLDMVSGQVVLAYARKEDLNVQCRRKQVSVKEAA